MAQISINHNKVLKKIIKLSVQEGDYYYWIDVLK